MEVDAGDLGEDLGFGPIGVGGVDGCGLDLAQQGHVAVEQGEFFGRRQPAPCGMLLRGGEVGLAERGHGDWGEWAAA